MNSQIKEEMQSRLNELITQSYVVGKSINPVYSNFAVKVGNLLKDINENGFTPIGDARSDILIQKDAVDSQT